MRRFTTAGLLGAAVLLASAVAGDPPAAGGALELAAKAELRAGGVLHVTATFRNGGTEALTFFVPEFHDAENFPGWRLVREDGAAVVPYAAPYQSIWTEGDQGTLVRLAPQKSWSVEHVLTLFLRESDGRDAHLTPLPLEPGRWRVVCAHAQKDATIPVGGPNFSVTRRTVAGLWTGRIEAASVEVVVPRPAVVSLRIDAPRDALAGKPYPLTVTLRNDTDRPQTLDGVLTISAASKPQGNAVARVLLDAAPRAARAGETQSLPLAAGEERRFTVDLALLEFVKPRQGARPEAMIDAVGQGIFALDASFGHPDASTRLDSNGLWRYAQPAPRPGARR